MTKKFKNKSVETFFFQGKGKGGDLSTETQNVE